VSTALDPEPLFWLALTFSIAAMAFMVLMSNRSK
jgi:uncharacterized membrane protein